MATKVLGYGNRKAKLMLVGEAPSYNEVREGKPFVGQAGQELDKLLSSAGIRRDELYITNAVLEQVTGDKKEFFFKGGKPSLVYVEGLKALYDDIQDIRPNCIVTLGNYAMWSLSMMEGIMKRRGSIYWSDMAGVKFIPTIHPAALLRGKPDGADKLQGGLYKYRNPVIWDLQKAKEQSQFPELRQRPRNIIVDPVGEQADECIQRLLRAEKLVFDIESWGGTKIACVGFSDGDPEWSVVFSYSGQSDRLALYKQLLESDTPKYGQNLMYDVTMLDQNGIHTKNIVWDTMIAQHVLLPDLPKALDFMNSIYTDMPYYKDEGKVWNKPKTPEIEAQYYLYNGKDVCCTAEIVERQREDLIHDKLMPVYERTMEVFESLRWATFKGMKCNHKTLFDFIQSTQEAAEKAQKELDEYAGHEINVNSPPQVKKFLYQELKLSDSKTQSSDAPTILNIAAKTGHPAPYLIVKVRKERKLLSNYYNTGILSPDGRVRFGFNVVGTFGARISSSAPLWGTGLNGQNIPHKSRRMLEPDDGYTLLEFDQAQAEAVIVAYLANDPIHMDCFRTGKDVHRVTACLLTDRPMSDWQQVPKPSGLRELAKTCNHELNYNAGPGQFQLTVNEAYDPEDPTSVNMTFSMAQQVRNKYLETRPALPAYWESIKAELKLNRTLVNPLGRRFQFLDAWSNDLLNRAYSYKPQSVVGETTNMGIVQVTGEHDLEKDMDDRYLLQREITRLGHQFLLQVHDSTIWQVPDDEVDTFVPLAMKLLEVPLQINGHHIVVPIEGAKGKTWYKGDMDSVGISRNTVEL